MFRKQFLSIKYHAYHNVFSSFLLYGSPLGMHRESRVLKVKSILWRILKCGFVLLKNNCQKTNLQGSPLFARQLLPQGCLPRGLYSMSRTALRSLKQFAWRAAPAHGLWAANNSSYGCQGAGQMTLLIGGKTARLPWNCFSSLQS